MQPQVRVAFARPVEAGRVRRLLEPADLERLDRLVVPADADAFATAHALLRCELASFCGVDVRDAHTSSICDVCGGAHGRPIAQVDGGAGRGPDRVPAVSLAHTHALAVSAVSGVGPVGVDVEPTTAAARMPDVASTLLHADERVTMTALGLLTTWVRKESLLKATGDGVTLDLRAIRFSDPGEPPRLIEWPGRRLAGSVHLTDLDVGPDHLGCVTVLAPQRPALTVVRAEPAEWPR